MDKIIKIYITYNKKIILFLSGIENWFKYFSWIGLYIYHHLNLTIDLLR